MTAASRADHGDVADGVFVEAGALEREAFGGLLRPVTTLGSSDSRVNADANSAVVSANEFVNHQRAVVAQRHGCSVARKA